jgi:Protein of unknown function (DUF3592)
MSIEIAIWLVGVGAFAAIVGLTSLRQAQRLRDSGHSAWGLVIAPPAGRDSEPPAVALIQYALPDGRVLEHNCRQPGRRSSAFRLGEKVLLWYDPANPAEVLVHRRDGHRSDWTFFAIGTLVILLGAVYPTLVR